jgi:hypothetical protein
MWLLNWLLAIVNITYRFADVLIAQEVTRAKILFSHQLVVNNSK